VATSFSHFSPANKTAAPFWRVPKQRGPLAIAAAAAVATVFLRGMHARTLSGVGEPGTAQ
jgi:hypothetical protein